MLFLCIHFLAKIAQCLVKQQILIQQVWDSNENSESLIFPGGVSAIHVIMRTYFSYVPLTLPLAKSSAFFTQVPPYHFLVSIFLSFPS